MLQVLFWKGRVTCPAPESLVPHALGAGDLTIARHVEGCAVCQAEVALLNEAADLLRAQTSLQHRTETPDCLEELAIADFVEGRLTPEARAPLVAHLLTCARCRLLVRQTGDLLADAAVAGAIPGTNVPGPRPAWRRWSLPVGIAAAAAVLLLVWPRSNSDIESTPRLREPTLTKTGAPITLVPRAAVARVDRLVWSSVAGVDRYRVRLYDREGALMWTSETADTVVTLPTNVVSTPGIYLWKVEAQTELGRWTGSELTEFRTLEPER